VTCVPKSKADNPKSLQPDNNILNQAFIEHDTHEVEKAQGTIQLEYGDSIYSSSTKYNILALKYNDSKCLNLLSTIHKDNQMIEKMTNKKMIPICVSDFIKYMRGVDKHDQFLSYNPITRKSAIYYKKLFFYLVDIIIFNCFVLFKEKNTDKKIKTLHDFKILLGQQLCELFDERMEMRVEPLEEHLIVRNIDSATKKPKKLRCVECKKYGKRSEPSWKCQKCTVSLCVGCFANYHKNLVN